MREASQGLDFVVVEPANDDRVDLHWMQAKFLSQADARQYLSQTIAPRDFCEVVASERIQAEADAAEASVTQCAPLLWEERTVSSHRQVGEAGNACNAYDQLLDIVTQERLASGQPDLLNTETHRETDDAFNLLERQDVRPGDPLLHDGRRIGEVRPVAAIKVLRRLGFGQAIEATKVAAVREAHPQVAQDAPLRIDERPGIGHLAGGLVAAGRLVRGGMTLTEPSALTSTFRS